MSDGFLNRRVIRPLVGLLDQGLTPEKIALSIALGAAIGVFPALGTTSGLCAVAALVFRLNLPAIQIVNYLMYPVQIALLLPFFRVGEKVFGAKHLPLSVTQIYEMLHASIWTTIALLWTTTWHAIVIWVLLTPFFVLIVYGVLAPLLSRALRRRMQNAPEPV